MPPTRRNSLGHRPVGHVVTRPSPRRVFSVKINDVSEQGKLLRCTDRLAQPRPLARWRPFDPHFGNHDRQAKSFHPTICIAEPLTELRAALGLSKRAGIERYADVIRISPA